MDKFGGAEEHRNRLWTRLAFASRYGHQPMSELMEMDFDDLIHYCDALAEIIKEENKTTK